MLARYFLIFSVLFVVTACDHSKDESLVGEIPAMEHEAITDGTGASQEMIDVYGEDMAGALATQDYLEQKIGDRVFFGYDSYSLTNEARQTLLAQAKWLQRFPKLNITVEGHCDERGTREYNLALGERRASSVKTYLVALGVDPSRVNVISYGKERPMDAGSDEAAWAKNRRGVTVIE